MQSRRGRFHCDVAARGNGYRAVSLAQFKETLTMQQSFVSFRQSLPRSIWDWLILLLLLLCALFFLMPIYVMVVTGLNQAQNVSLSTMWHLPTQLSVRGVLESWRRRFPILGNIRHPTIPQPLHSAVPHAVSEHILSNW